MGTLKIEFISEQRVSTKFLRPRLLCPSPTFVTWQLPRADMMTFFRMIKILDVGY